VCGIAGFIQLESSDSAQQDIRDMTEALAHRGPDGDGVHLVELPGGGAVALGHRRLAIIDPAGGQQPMANEDESIWITYNGEIYNFRKLRGELEQAGHGFATQSDTEVVLHAYKQWGAQCVERMQGMFAFAIADFSRQQIFLARDRVGIKPLYYRRDARGFFFASQLASLRRVANIEWKMNFDVLDRYLRFGYICHPDTIYQDTFKLAPSSSMVVGFDGKVSDPQTYWSLDFAADLTTPRSQWIDSLEQTIESSVKAHLVSDVPFGVFLSGGIDSTLIASRMARLLGPGVKAFTIGFEDDDDSEVKYAEQVAQKCNLDLTVEFVKPSAVELMSELISHYGEPFGDSSAVPTWYVSRLARQSVPMVLSGDGGDELFAGYGDYGRWMSYRPAWWLSQLFVAKRSSRAVRTLWSELFHRKQAQQQRWYSLRTVFGREDRIKLWRSPFHRHVVESCPGFDLASQQAANFDELSYAQYIDIFTFLSNDILPKVDVASMCHGLEVRPALLDVHMLEAAGKTRPSLRYHREGPEGQPVLKYALKKIVEKEFGSEFVHRRKQAFAIPERRWIKHETSRDLIQQLLLDHKAPINQILNVQAIEQCVEQVEAGAVNARRLWILLVLGMWLNENSDVLPAS